MVLMAEGTMVVNWRRKKAIQRYSVIFLTAWMDYIS
jgi:hypothetical protein